MKHAIRLALLAFVPTAASHGTAAQELVHAPGPAAQRAAAALSATSARALPATHDDRGPAVGVRRPTIPGRGGVHASRYGRQRRPEPVRFWVPGRWEVVPRRLWVPERVELVWVEPVHEWRVDYRGVRFRVLVRGGCYEEVVRPGHYATREERVWVPGHWSVR